MPLGVSPGFHAGNRRQGFRRFHCFGSGSTRTLASSVTEKSRLDDAARFSSLQNAERDEFVRFQFRIRTLLVAFVFIALGCWSFVNILRNQPPHWQPFSAATLQTALDQKQSVLITLSARWDINTMINELTAISSTDAFRCIRDHGLVTLRADFTNFDPAVKQLMIDNGLTCVPAFLLFNSVFPNDPVILRDLVSKEQLLDAIRYNAARSAEPRDGSEVKKLP